MSENLIETQQDISDNQVLSDTLPLNDKDKYFIFQEETFPINFELIKQNSSYFLKNHDQFENVESIELLQNNDQHPILITTETIQRFISYCQNEPCEFDSTDTISLLYLSLKYGVTKLTTFINDYISQNHQEYIFQSIQLKDPETSTTNDYFDTVNSDMEEEIIASHFLEYINDDRIFSLSLSIL